MYVNWMQCNISMRLIQTTKPYIEKAIPFTGWIVSCYLTCRSAVILLWKEKDFLWLQRNLENSAPIWHVWTWHYFQLSLSQLVLTITAANRFNETKCIPNCVCWLHFLIQLQIYRYHWASPVFKPQQENFRDPLISKNYWVISQRTIYRARFLVCGFSVFYFRFVFQDLAMAQNLASYD